MILFGNHDDWFFLVWKECGSLTVLVLGSFSLDSDYGSFKSLFLFVRLNVPRRPTDPSQGHAEEDSASQLEVCNVAIVRNTRSHIKKGNNFRATTMTAIRLHDLMRHSSSARVRKWEDLGGGGQMNGLPQLQEKIVQGGVAVNGEFISPLHILSAQGFEPITWNYLRMNTCG